MAKTEYLGGRVVKWSLPIISGRPGPDAPALKRLLLPQGEVAQVHDSDEGIHYLAVLEVRAGAARGNHYHRVKVEWIYVVQARLRVLAQDLGTNERASVTLDTGDLLLIQTGVAHVLQTIEPGLAIEFSPTRFDPADSFPFILG
jgi:hypothetical protein